MVNSVADEERRAVANGLFDGHGDDVLLFSYVAGHDNEALCPLQLPDRIGCRLRPEHILKRRHQLRPRVRPHVDVVGAHAGAGELL